MSTRTAGLLESGVPGNILGGMGSGLAYAGRNTFLALPDRGPNAVAYGSTVTLVDDTTSYIPRFQTVNLSLAKNPSFPASSTLPYILSPFLTSTTLLSSKAPLVYGAGDKTVGGILPAGAPSLNSVGKYYFSGRSDNFNSAASSTNPRNGRLDPEGIRVSNDGKSIFITDEYGPYVYQFNRNNGNRIKTFTLPANYAVTNLRSFEKGATGEIAANTTGRLANKGMESLAITPDGTTLVGLMQANLIQDTVKYLRIVTIDIASGAITHEYAYKLGNGTGTSDILAISNTEFLVTERDGKGLGDSSNAVEKKLYKIDLSAATDIKGASTVGAATPVVTKTLFLDLVSALVVKGIPANLIPAKIEGAAFGPDMVIDGVTKHTLFIANDNDFLPTAILDDKTTEVANPNQFFVFAIDASDLPNFVAQPVTPPAIDQREHG